MERQLAPLTYRPDGGRGRDPDRLIDSLGAGGACGCAQMQKVYQYKPGLFAHWQLIAFT